MGSLGSCCCCDETVRRVVVAGIFFDLCFARMVGRAYAAVFCENLRRIRVVALWGEKFAFSLVEDTATNEGTLELLV